MTVAGHEDQRAIIRCAFESCFVAIIVDQETIWFYCDTIVPVLQYHAHTGTNSVQKLPSADMTAHMSECRPDDPDLRVDYRLRCRLR